MTLPGSITDREMGKFRPVPGRGKDGRPNTAVAVTDELGNAIGSITQSELAEMLIELRAIRLGLEILTDTDLRNQG